MQPPTIDQFEKLIELRHALNGLASGDANAGDALLGLLPGLRDVFGPVFPAVVHEHLGAIESALLSGQLDPEGIADRTQAISQALGIPLAPAE